MPPRRQPQAPALALDVATIADLRRANAASQRDNNGLRRQIELLTQRMDGSRCFLKMPPKRVQALGVVVPEFDGELDDDVIDWLSRVEEIFEFQAVPADRRVPLVKIRLHGRAQAWWQQLKQTRRRLRKSKITDWEKFKKHVKAAFLPYNYECDLSQRFPTLRKGSLGGSVSVVGGLRSRMFVSGGGDWHLSPKFVSMTQGFGGMYDEMNRSWDLSTEEEFCSNLNRMGVRDDEYVSQVKYRDAEFSWLGSPDPFRVDTRDLFVDGSIVDIHPSSGNPIYDDYADDECYTDNFEDAAEVCHELSEFSHCLSNPIYGDYSDDECYVDNFEDEVEGSHDLSEFSHCLSNPIYDDYVVESYFDDFKHGVVGKFVAFYGNGMAELKFISSLKFLSEVSSRFKSLEKEKESEETILLKQIALLYEAWTESILEISNRKALMSTNNPSSMDVRMNVKSIEPGEDFFLSEEHVKDLPERLTTAVKDLNNAEQELLKADHSIMQADWHSCLDNKVGFKGFAIPKETQDKVTQFSFPGEEAELRHGSVVGSRDSIFGWKPGWSH